MTTKSVLAVASTLLVMMGVFLVFLLERNTGTVEERLSVAEGKRIRQLIYQDGAAFTTPTEGRWARKRLIVVPNWLEDMYQRKPHATIGLLLKILEGGRPQDALAAAGYIGALIKDPVYGALIAMNPAKKFDDLIEDCEETLREHILASSLKIIKENDKASADRERPKEPKREHHE